MIDQYFNFNHLLTSCVDTTGQHAVELTSASLLERERERERENALSAMQANLIRDRLIRSSSILTLRFQVCNRVGRCVFTRKQPFDTVNFAKINGPLISLWQ